MKNNSRVDITIKEYSFVRPKNSPRAQFPILFAESVNLTTEFCRTASAEEIGQCIKKAMSKIDAQIEAIKNS